MNKVLKENSIYKENFKNIANGLDLLDDILDNSIKVSFFDPQYRGVLDKLGYGNEGKSRGKERCSLEQMDEDTIKLFIKKINRVISPSGYLFLWVDKFHLCQGLMDWFEETEMNLVDLIVWDKDRMGMGYRTRRISEYLVVFQKSPVKAKVTWTNHSIPDVWKEKVVKVHTHSKPIELQKVLIEATSEKGDYILDPASGGYSVFNACKLCNRNFIGGDIKYGEENFMDTFGKKEDEN